jgi:hypothetical protein
MVRLELPPRAIATRYRLMTCEAGCGPVGLELVWRVPKEGTTMATIWMDSAQRRQVQTILDAAAEQEQGSSEES